MNRDETKHAIAVMQAWLDGKTVQARAKNWLTSEWITLTKWSPDDFVNYDYRIKPEPREFWVMPGGGGVIEEGPPTAHSGWVRVREVLEDE